jgi:hypothetical protein
MAFPANCTAANAMTPTVLAFIPLNNAYTIGGSRSGIFCTPSDSAYMPTAPGNDQSKNANSAAPIPACIIAIQKTIFVDAGPGRAWHIANNS